VAQILDCTFRDGGYQTDWHFSASLVGDYLGLIHKFGVQIAEIGFRSAVTLENKDSGPFLFSDEKFLHSLSLPEELQLAVMVNADEISNVEAEIDSLFVPASQSRVSLVRIAARINSVKMSHEIASHLKRKGYKVALNLMESSPELLRGKEFMKIREVIESFDYLFLADSFGVLTPMDIKEIDSIIREIRPDYGLHLHDNRGLAYANSLEAIQGGVRWLDATALGLGRGAGNLRTEQLIIDMCGTNILGSAQFSKLLDVLEVLFNSSKNAASKGLSALYFLGAKYNIHPSVVFALIKDADTTRAVELISGQENWTKSV
jgi:4-hydroxy 2-oxovalerate aldolase